MVQTRNKLTSAGAFALAAGLILFSLIFPAGERVQHIATIQSGDLEDVPNAIKHLCWIRKGQEALDETLPHLAFDRRRVVLKMAAAEGCIHKLDPKVQAAYYILDAEGEQHLEKAAGLGKAAVGPAMEAFHSNDPQLRVRGAFVVGTLERHLSESQREKARELLNELPPGDPRKLLAVQLGIVQPEPEPTDEEPTVFDEINVSEQASPESDEPPVDGLRLQEPSLQVPRGGVLFRAGPPDEEPPSPRPRPEPKENPTPRTKPVDEREKPEAEPEARTVGEEAEETTAKETPREKDARKKSRETEESSAREAKDQPDAEPDEHERGSSEASEPGPTDADAAEEEGADD